MKKISIFLLIIPLLFFNFFFIKEADAATSALQSCYPGTMGNGGFVNGSYGYKFTPATNGQIATLCGSFVGTKTVKLYNSSYSVLASASIASSGWWACASVTPVDVTAGAIYYVVGELSSVNAGYLWVNFPKSCAGITIQNWVTQSPAGTFNAGHNESTYGGMVGLVDVVFTYSISATKTGTGSGQIQLPPSGWQSFPRSQGYNSGESVWIATIPDTGSVFTGWSGACSGTDNWCNIVMNGSKTVSANFEKQFSLTVSGSGPGQINVNPPGGDRYLIPSFVNYYNSSTSVTLTPVPGTNAIFAGWSGACSGTGPCTLIMNADKAVTATFSQQMVLTVDRSGYSTGSGRVIFNPPSATTTFSLPHSEKEAQGASVSLTAIPDTNSVFYYWIQGGSGYSLGTANPYVYTSNSATYYATIYAVFLALPDTAILSGPPLVTNQTWATFSFSGVGHSSTNFLTHQCQLDSGGFSLCADSLYVPPKSYYGLTQGIHTFEVAAVNSAGQDPSPASYTWLIDTTSPTVSALDVQPRFLNAANPTATITWTVTDTGGSYLDHIEVWRAPNAGGVPGTWAKIGANYTAPADANSWTSSATDSPGDGTYWYGLHIVDKAGNVGTDSSPVKITKNTYALNIAKSGMGSGTVTSNPAGINCGTGCFEPYAPGTSVTLVAEESSTSTFVGWSGDCSGKSACTLSMNADKNVTAMFSVLSTSGEIPYTGTFEYLFSGMVPGVIYSYKVLAHNAGGWSDLTATNERKAVIYVADGSQGQFKTLPPPNSPPNSPEIPDPYKPSGVTWDNCIFLGHSIPTFYWTYSDQDNVPLGTDSQTAYELEVDENDSFHAPKFNHLVNNAATSYVLDLSQDDDSDWIAALDWNATYFWRVRVKDSHNNWSEWSRPAQFKTPKEAYPYSGFSWEPQEPNQKEVVIFTPDDTGLPSYLWIITEGGENAVFTDDTGPTSPQPHIKFGSITNKIKLQVTRDSYTCESEEYEITANLPLPEYHETSPIIWLKQSLSSLASLLDGLYFFGKF